MHQTSCHTAAALKFCLDTRKRATRPAAVRFIEEHTGFAVSEADTSEVYPPASANRVQRAAVVMVTGNIGHDLLSLLDIFSQQQVARRARVFDALILEGFWFAGVGGFQTALQSPRQSWTLAMIDALLNTSHHGQQRGTHAVPTYAVEYSPRRRTRLSRFRRAGTPPFSTMPPLLCIDELYLRARNHQAGDMGWGNAQYVPELDRKSVV